MEQIGLSSVYIPKIACSTTSTYFNGETFRNQKWYFEKKHKYLQTFISTQQRPYFFHLMQTKAKANNSLHIVNVVKSKK